MFWPCPGQPMNIWNIIHRNKNSRQSAVSAGVIFRRNSFFYDSF
jgi:hypothetical protein